MSLPENPSVSIVVVTQYARRHYIKRLFRCFDLQYYNNIIEILIIDTSIVKKRNEFKNLITNLSVSCRFKIRYLAVSNDIPKTIGSYRNFSNDNINPNSDIIIAADDDDYIVRDRVSHAVESYKNNPTKLVAGCCDHYIYEPDLDIILKFTIFMKGHTINPCLAYRKEYLLNHRYDGSRTFAEEGSFMNNFTEDFIPLDPAKVFLQMCHLENLYSKRELLLNNITKVVTPYCHPTNLTLKDFIGFDGITYKMFDINDRYQPYLDADIVCYLGHLDANDTNIEEYIKKWEEAGLRVQVFSHKDGTFKHFQARFKYDVLVLSNKTALLLYEQTKLTAISLYVHVNDYESIEIKEHLKQKYRHITVLD